MRRFARFLVPVGLFAALVFPPTAIADHGSADLASPNMQHVDNVPRTQAVSQSDLAFWQGGSVRGPFHDLLFAGNYNSLRILDIKNPEQMRVVSELRCRGPQNDVSVENVRNRLLLIASVDRPQTTADCATSADTPIALFPHPITGVPTPLAVPGFEGLRIFDVTNPEAPVQIASVPTACGSHTHTTIADDDEQRLVVYVSSYPLGAGISPDEVAFPDFGGPRCTIPHARISIVEIPYDSPETPIVREQPLHADTLPFTRFIEGTFAIGCHDITAYFDANEQPESSPHPTANVAAAACLSEGQLWDISDPAHPDTLGRHTHVRNEFVDIWHSSTLTWDGQVTLFGDEWAGGGAHGCDGPQDTRGNIWFYRTVPPGTPTAPLLGRYMIPRPQPANEVCTLHNFNIIPTNEGYFGVVAANEGGTSVFDFTGVENLEPVPEPVTTTTDVPTAAREIAFFDPQNTDGRARGNPWSSYWYNDFIFANDRRRGVDSFLLLGQNGRLLDKDGQPVTDPTDRSVQQVRARKFHHENPQTQEVFQTLGN